MTGFYGSLADFSSGRLDAPPVGSARLHFVSGHRSQHAEQADIAERLGDIGPRIN
jgi:hypothetical protein